MNYYVTSDRWLDERMQYYPQHSHGGNGRDAYADVEAVRARRSGISGHRAILDWAWQRYGLPVALTEVHLGCTREEQLRWLYEAWAAAQSARDAGVDVRALTVWSLLGAFDWNSLLTKARGHYESGAFDVRSGLPRPTALAHMTRALATRGRYEHALLESPGWWRRPERLLHSTPDESPEHRTRTSRVATPAFTAHRAAAPVIILGDTPEIDDAFAGACNIRGIVSYALHPAEAATNGTLQSLLARRPFAVVHVSDGLLAPGLEGTGVLAHEQRLEAAVLVARACKRASTRLLVLSSDCVFDGTGTRPYFETDVPKPQNAIGRRQLQLEIAYWPNCRAHSSFGVAPASALTVLAII